MNWSTLVLGDSLEVLIDNRGKNPEFSEQGVPAISGMYVGDGVLDLSSARRVSAEVWDKWMPNKTQRHDVVLTSEAPLGRVALVPSDEPLTLAQRVFGLRGRAGVLDSRFLFYAFQTSQVQADLQGRATGTTVLGIRQPALLKVQIPAPGYEEQQAIAEVLGALDDKIVANIKFAKTSAILAQALFVASMRAADHEVALSEVTELLTRGVAPKYSEADDTVVVLNQKCIRDQRVNLDPARRTLISKVRKDKMLRMDDVLVNSTGQGTLGRVARWTQSGGVTVDSHITIVRFDQAKVDPVCAGMSLLASQQTIEEMGEGSTGQTELSRTELGKLRLRLPDRNQQAELGHRIKSMSEMESARLRENQTLAATRDTLLPQLMSGKLRVKDAEKVLENAGV